MTRICLYCKQPGDLRPYGPNGADVCFQCAHETPDRSRQVDAMLEQAWQEIEKQNSIAVVDKDGLRGLTYEEAVNLEDGHDGKE